MTDPTDRPREELRRTCAALREAECEAALLSSTANVTYASGWEVPVPLGAGAELAWGQPLLLIAARDEAAWLIVPNGNENAARAVAAVDEVVPFETFDSFKPTDSRQSFLDAIDWALRVGGNRIGAARSRSRSGHSRWRSIELLGKRSRVAAHDAEEPLQRARMIKTEREIGLLRQAVGTGRRRPAGAWASSARRPGATSSRCGPRSGERLCRRRS